MKFTHIFKSIEKCEYKFKSFLGRNDVIFWRKLKSYIASQYLHLQKKESKKQIWGIYLLLLVFFLPIYIY